MARYRCNSCGAEYEDRDAAGVMYFHACPTDKITHAVTDDKGNVVTPEKREPLPNRRDENAPKELIYIEGKPKLRKRDPNDPTRVTFEDADSLVRSEGAGRTAL